MILYEFNGPTFTKRKTSGEQAYAILLTLPERFFEEYPGGEKSMRQVMAFIDASEMDYWMQTISGIPVQDVAYAYLVFKGRVQYRLCILEYSAGDQTWPRAGGGVRRFLGRKWVHLCGPVVKAPSDFLIRGFQGFRYTSFIF